MCLLLEGDGHFMFIYNQKFFLNKKMYQTLKKNDYVEVMSCWSHNDVIKSYG